MYCTLCPYNVQLLILPMLLHLGKSRLRDVFLKVDNDIEGAYYGHLIKVEYNYY